MIRSPAPAPEHLTQFGLGRHVDTVAGRMRGVDEAERLIGLAGKEQSQVDAGLRGHADQFGGAATQRLGVQHVDR